MSEREDETGFDRAAGARETVPNTPENLRLLLTRAYVCADAVAGGRWTDEDRDEYLDALLAAGEGRPFVPFRLPMPRGTHE